MIFLMSAFNISRSIKGRHVKKFIALFTAVCVVFVFSACGADTEPTTSQTETSQTTQQASTQPAEQWEWQKSSPEDQGFDGSVLDDVNDTYDSFPMLAAVIVKNGYIIDVYYKDGYDETSSFLLHSASKSVTSALVGIAIEQGYIESVDTPLAQYFPELYDREDTRWQRITIRHLLTHTSGIDCGDTEFEDEWRASDNWIEFVLNRPMAHEPGTFFNYSTANTHLLCAVLQQATGEDLYEFGKEYLFDPVGMDSVRIDTDAQGISDGGNGIYMDIYDMARFGLLYLNGGEWQGRQVIPAEWVEESTTLQFERDSGSADYGYQWWVRTFGDNDYPAFFAQGHAGQYIFVVPDLELIIAFTGDYEGRTSIYWRLANQIVNACYE